MEANLKYKEIWEEDYCKRYNQMHENPQDFL